MRQLWVVAAVAALMLPTFARGTVRSTPEPARKLVNVEIPGSAIARRFPDSRSISFRYPSNWHVATRRLDDVIDPRTVFAAASYALPKGRSDDCDGTHARGRPADGVFVLVKETLDGASLRLSLPRLPARPRHFFKYPTSGVAGCLPATSATYQFRVAQRAFYVYISVGPKASTATRTAVAHLLDGMWIARYPTP